HLAEPRPRVVEGHGFQWLELGAIGSQELDVLTGAGPAADAETAFMHAPVVVPTQEDQVPRTGGAAIASVDDVVAVQQRLRAPAARERATSIARLHQPA